MHVKRIYASSIRDALASAREQLGDHALVLSTELVPSPGWRGWVGQRMVRLTAAAQRGSESDVPAPVVVSEDRPEVPVDRPRRPDARAGVMARLAAVGLSPTFADVVAGRMTEADCRSGGDDAVRRALAGALDSLSAPGEGFARYEVFVGPPGVGKTTTIAKIAAHARASGGPRLGLVAADAFRAGAIEQLRSYAGIVGSPFRVARSADELERALTGTRQPSLIDTAGRSAPDGALTDLFAVLGRKRDVRTHLVIAADTSPATARRLFDRYARLEPARVVITKLDEADSMMPLVDAVRERGLAISYLTAGQRVPEDLQRATPAGLAAALLREPVMEDVTCH
jgi:flagellar biosynthesis protein FlhF